MKIEINWKFIVICGLVLVGAFFLLWRGCNGNSAAIAKANTLSDSAIKANAEKDRKMAILDARNESLLKDSAQQRANAEALAAEANTSYEAVFAAQNETKSYQNKYADARRQVNDLLALATCDSLTQAVTIERVKNNKAQQDCKNQVNNLGDILANRNKQISVLNQQVAVLKQPANIVNDALHAVKAATKEPLIKGYLGAEADFGAGKSFLGGGPSVFLAFRGGFALKGAVKFLNGGSAYEVGAFKIISFKKK